MISGGSNTGPSVQQSARSAVSLAELMGWPAANDILLRVDQGVFPPHPDTVAMIDWCAAELDAVMLASRKSLIVDLCTGTGFIAIALAALFPNAQIVAVDSAEVAAACAAHNSVAVPARVGGPITVRCGDATSVDTVADLIGAADLVVANPPYLADHAQAPADLGQLVAATALFGGVDGLSVVRGVVRVAEKILKSDGVIAVEHAAAQEQDVTQILADIAQFTAIQGHRDHRGTHRFLTARRS